MTFSVHRFQTSIKTDKRARGVWAGWQPAPVKTPDHEGFMAVERLKASANLALSPGSNPGHSKISDGSQNLTSL